MGSTLFLNDVDQTALLHDESPFNFGGTCNQRGSASVPLVLDPESSYSPQIGWKVQIYDTGVSRYLGMVLSIDIHWLSDPGWRGMTLTCVSLEAMFDAIIAAGAYISKSAQFIFQALFGLSFPYMIAVTEGIVEGSGFLMADRSYDGSTSDASAFSQLATDCAGFVWYVDPVDATVNFHSFIERTLDIVLSDQIIFGTLVWKQTGTDFRDRQVIQLVGGGTVVVSNSQGTVLGVGPRFQVMVAPEGTSTVDATAQANAALAQYSVLPSQFSFQSDSAGWRHGFRMLVAIDDPETAAAILNGYWLIQDVQASWIPGMELNSEPYGHFRYTVTCVNSMAVVPYQSTLSRIVQPTPPITTQPPDWTGGGSGSAPGPWVRTLLINDTLAGDDIANHVPIYTPMSITSPLIHAVGQGVRIVAVLRRVLAFEDLVVRINMLGVAATSWTITIPQATPVDTPLVTDISSDSFYDLNILTADITAGAFQQLDVDGIASLTVEWEIP